MTQSPGLFLTVLAFLLVVGPLVFVHELGHYLAGRWFGVKADEFSIGFGREVAGFTDRRGTRWKFGWLPMGGYVRFAGDMNPASQPSAEWMALPPEERAKTFQAKPLWQRAIIVAAGPVTNFLVAIVILAAFATLNGVDRRPAMVGMVSANSPAMTAGLKAGDRITAIDGRAMNRFEDLFDYVAMRPDAQIAIDFERNGTPMHASATIRRTVETDPFGNKNERGLLGIGPPPPEFVRVGLFEAPFVAVAQTARIVRTTVDGLVQVITGRLSVQNLGGPVKIAQISGQSLAMGPEGFVYLLAFVSINLGFINLLPVPVLDGGHLLFYAVEAIRRRPVEPRVMEWAYGGGLVAILALLLLVTFNDLGGAGMLKSLAGLHG